MTIIVLELMTRRLSTMAGVPGEGTEPPPPPAAGPLLTSLLYPIEVVERMDVAPEAPTGHMWYPVDDLAVAAGVDSGTLDVTIAYKTLDAEVEAIDPLGDLDGGVLEVVIEYETLTAEVEALDVLAGVDSGLLEVVINYINQDVLEALNVSAALDSGALA